MIAYKSPPIHRTPFYRANAAYYGMQARCLNKNGRNPSYAKVELRMTRAQWLKWAVPQYKKWLAEHPNETPNAARIGDKGHYELGNVRIISQRENCYEQSGRFISRVMPDGTKRCSGCKLPRPVDMFSKNKTRWDGLSSHCKECVSGYAKKRRLKRGPVKSKRQEIRHGTHAGYTAETYRKIPHCEACKKANAEYARQKRKGLVA